MAESFMQVPVSLIERAPHDRGCASFSWNGVGWDNDPAACNCWKVKALSQPTLTANDGDRLIEFAEQILGVPLDPWQMRLCRRVFGGNVGHSTGRPDAAPPRIAEMVPGTTFGYPERWTAGPPNSQGRQWAYRSGEGRYLERYLDEFDPSTIRDVQPPKET